MTTELAQKAAKEIAVRTGKNSHDIAIVLGSGWGDAINSLGKPTYECATEDLPGFLPPLVEGHSGKIRSYSVVSEGKEFNLLAFLGRNHLYEGRGMDVVTHGVKTAVAAGCKIVLLTNAAGGINKDYKVGQPVIIKDHISLTFQSPLVGPNFVDLTDLYSKRIRAIVKGIDPTLVEGVFVQTIGPMYETPAEINAMRVMGGDVVAMSTVPEAISAHALGAEVFAISLVTNSAAGVTGEKLSHEEVIAAGKASSARIGELITKILPKIII